MNKMWRGSKPPSSKYTYLPINVCTNNSTHYPVAISIITLRILSGTIIKIAANKFSIESKNVIQDSMSRDVRITEIKSWNRMYCIPSSVVSNHRITMIIFYGWSKQSEDSWQKEGRLSRRAVLTVQHKVVTATWKTWKKVVREAAKVTWRIWKRITLKV